MQKKSPVVAFIELTCLSLLLIFITIVFSCNNDKETTQQHLPEPENTYYPYSPRLDVNFPGKNNANAATVLNIWRGIGSGNITGFRKFFADSVTLVFADALLTGSAENVLRSYEKRRLQLATLQVHVDFWTPVYNEERNEDWVLIWVSQEGTKHNKQLDSKALHQVWKFNSAGLIYLMQEYNSSWHW